MKKRTKKLLFPGAYPPTKGEFPAWRFWRLNVISRMTTVFAVFVSLVCATPALAETAEQAVRAAETAVNNAYARNDLDRYFSYYAPQLNAFFTDGRWDYAGYKTSWTKFIEGGGRVEHLKVSDMIIQVAPSKDAAVVSYMVDIHVGGPGSSADDSGRFQETDTWFLGEKGWQIVAIHYSPAAK